jgi:hypothetical protein
VSRRLDRGMDHDLMIMKRWKEWHCVHLHGHDTYMGPRWVTVSCVLKLYGCERPWTQWCPAAHPRAQALWIVPRLMRVVKEGARTICT